MYRKITELPDNTRVTPLDLLHAGGLRNIKIITPVPENCVAQRLPSTREMQAQFNEMMFFMEFLELSDDNCRTIELHGSVTIDYFWAGYEKSINAGYNRRVSDNGENRHVWAVVEKSQAPSLKPKRLLLSLSLENLYIFEIHLDLLTKQTRKQTNNANTPAETPQAPKGKERKNDLDTPIENAISETNSEDIADIYRKLSEYAKNSMPPFTGHIDNEGIYYTSGDGLKEKSITKKALASRLKRRKDRQNRQTR